MAASFNATGVDSKSPIVPALDAGLVSGVVRTTPPPRVSRRVVQSIPGISGHGEVHMGLEPGTITWELTVEAASIAALQAFEDKLKEYEKGGAYTLVSEWSNDVEWKYVTLVGREPQGPPERTGENWLQTWRVTFRWLQPS